MTRRFSRRLAAIGRHQLLQESIALTADISGALETMVKHGTTPTDATDEIVKWVFNNGAFDPEWYTANHPDVAALGMQAEEHYRRFGADMRRAPNAFFDAQPGLLEAGARPAPAPEGALVSAHELAGFGQHDAAIRYAEMHVPAEHTHTIDTLRANRSLSRGDTAGWLDHLNRYLEFYGAAPIQLVDGGQLLERLSTRSLPEVTSGPMVSVIMPAFNAADTVAHAAASILGQTWRELELLIVDDASEDDTWGVLQGIAASDSRVRIFRNKVNVGPYASKNTMLSLASGEWITGHDADDWAHPQRLEQHLGAILAFKAPPRASMQLMLRMLPNGALDRFTKISHFSVDGIARDAPISCMFQSSFLRDDLGCWDSVRFGADSELLNRAKKLLGDEFHRHEQIGMFAVSFEGSLTNHAVHGVSRTTGPSQIRRDYAAAWRRWHSDLAPGAPQHHRLLFPPQRGGERPFAAPAAALVPEVDAHRNHAALTGEGTDHIPVTLICSSKRPAFLQHIAAQICAQTHPALHVVFVAHGPGHDQEAVRRSFEGVASITVIDLPEADETLGAALNMALARCETDLVAKIDDDDFYGPNYVRASVAAYQFNGHDNVGIIGRTRAYCYVEDVDALFIRFDSKNSNRLRTRVFGGTIFWSRSRLQNQQFRDLPRAIDTAFFKDAQKKGVAIFSGEPEDYVHVRYSQLSEHTWKANVEDFLRPATKLADGLRLDLALSSQRSPGVAALPKHSP